MSVRTGLGPRTGAEKATDGAGGSGHADRPPGFLPLTWHFQDARSLSPSPHRLARDRTECPGCRGRRFIRLFARAEQHLPGCLPADEQAAFQALLARLATHVYSLDPVAAACDAVVDIRSRA